MHPQHEEAEGGPELVGQRSVLHTLEHELDLQLGGERVNGQVLSAQAHVREQVQLVSASGATL